MRNEAARPRVAAALGSLRHHWRGPALAVIVLVGGWLRLAHPTWDDLTHANPDERYILWLATTVRLPDSWAQAWTTGLSPLDPYHWPPDAASEGISVPRGQERSFTYGHFALYLLALSASALRILGEKLPTIPVLAGLLNQDGQIPFFHLTLVARALSGLAGTLTLWAAVRMGRRAFGETVGLLAGAMLAVTVIHIQAAHFGTFDSLLTLFCTLAVGSAVGMAVSGKGRDAGLMGLWIALALGSKVTAIWMAIPASLAAFARPIGLTTRRQDADTLDGAEDRSPKLLPGWHAWAHGARQAGLVLAASGVVFCATNPFAVLERGRFLAEAQTQARIAMGELIVPFALAYQGTTPILYPTVQAIRWTMGAPLALMAILGSLWGLNRFRSTLDARLGVALAWVLPFGLFFTACTTKYPRYLLPILPASLVLGAGLLSHLLDRWRYVGRGVVVVVLGISAGYSLAFVRMVSEPHPWSRASDWIYERLPETSRIVVEQWDELLPIQSAERGQSPFNFTLLRIDSLSGDAAPDETLGLAASGDYWILATDNIVTALSRNDDQFPVAAELYRALFDGRAGYELAAVFHRAPDILGRPLLDDPFEEAGLDEPPGLRGLMAEGWRVGFADGSFASYDHPWVLIFRNVGRLSPEQLADALGVGRE